MLTSPAQPTMATCVRPAAASSSSAACRRPTSMVPCRSRGTWRRLRRPRPRTPRARPTTWCVSVEQYTRGSNIPPLPSREGCRPRRSPACCRAAPSPIRLAVDPPAVKVPAKPAGNPSNSISQRIARSSAKLPAALAHQRCATATAWARSAAAATSVGIVVTQPLKPGWPIRSPLSTTSWASSFSATSRPTPSTGSARPAQAATGSASAQDRAPEPHEAFQRQEDGADGAAQVVRGGTVRAVVDHAPIKPRRPSGPPGGPRGEEPQAPSPQ